MRCYSLSGVKELNKSFDPLTNTNKIVTCIMTLPFNSQDLISNSPYSLPYSSMWCLFGEFGIGSTYIPLIYIFLHSHLLSAWYCMDIVGEILSWSLREVKGLTKYWKVMFLCRTVTKMMTKGHYLHEGEY